MSSYLLHSIEGMNKILIFPNMHTTFVWRLFSTRTLKGGQPKLYEYCSSVTSIYPEVQLGLPHINERGLIGQSLNNLRPLSHQSHPKFDVDINADVIKCSSGLPSRCIFEALVKWTSKLIDHRRKMQAENPNTNDERFAK